MDLIDFCMPSKALSQLQQTFVTPSCQAMGYARNEKLKPEMRNYITEQYGK